MGRVYGLPGDDGVLSAMGSRLFTHTGEKVSCLVQRVEFDADADEGMATVTGIITDFLRHPLVDPQKGEACIVTFRSWVRLVHKGQPDPPKTPDVMLWDDGKGGVVAHEDPLPQVPFTVRETVNG